MSAGFFGSLRSRFGRVDDDAETAVAPAPEPAPAALAVAAPERSPLTALAKDPVALALLEANLITMATVIAALGAADAADTPLWRRLVAQPGVDRAKALAVAAKVRQYPVADLALRPRAEFIRTVASLFPDDTVRTMRALGLLPYELTQASPGRPQQLILVADDPEDPRRQAFLAGLGIAYDLRYADGGLIETRLAAALGPSQPLLPAQGDGLASAPPTLAPPETFAPSPPETAPVAPAPEAFVLAPAPVPTEAFAPAPTAPEVPPPTTLEAPFAPPVSVPEALPAAPAFEAAPGTFAPAAVPPPAEAAPAAAFAVPLEAVTVAPVPAEALLVAPVPAEPAAPFAPVPAEPVATGAPAPVATEAPAPAPAGPRTPVKDRVVLLLLRKGAVTDEQVEAARAKQEHDAPREALWRVLAEVSGVDREAIFAEAAKVYAFPAATLGADQPDVEFVRSVMATFPEDRREQLIALRVLPLECTLDAQTGAIRLVFITHDPTRPEVHRLMQALKLDRFELHYAPEPVVKGTLAEAYPRKNEFLERMQEGGGMAYDLGASYDQAKGALIDEDALEAEIGRSSLINLFEATLVEAVRQGASDVHIYPNARRQVEIHFRVDGRLNLWHKEEKVHPEALLAVIKDNSTNVDRFEREAAQDGFIQRWVDDALIRFRVSILPIANASQELRSESIVIRILDDRKVITDLKKLGLNGVSLERFDTAIRQPHGMVILTGPTGSGKSTTLVAALHQVVTPEVNVLTVEDPVEYIIPGVRQIKLNNKLGLEGALRAILRHDPDVVMVGEMRDRDTAELAIKLANTGHLTFSSLHTNDAPAAVSRLYKMGVEPFLIAYAINLVVAQRLIRNLCPTCKKVDDDPDPLQLRKLGFTEAQIAETTFYKASRDRSCKTCKGQGFKGRRAITEALHFSRAVRHAIVEAEGLIDEEKIRRIAMDEGMLTLQDSARLLVLDGETSVQEMMRVTASDG